MAELQVRVWLTGRLLTWAREQPAHLLDALAAGVRGLLEQVQRQATRLASGRVLRRRTGHLVRSIGPPVVTQTAQELTGELAVGAHYAPYLEYGTRPYVIYPVTATVLRWRDPRGQYRYARWVRHPGLRPRPFFEPAWAQMAQRAEATLGALIRRELQQRLHGR